MPRKKLWGGRFTSEEDPFFAEFNDSLPFDRELLEADIEGSLAYARALERAGVFARKERLSVEKGLRQLLDETMDEIGHFHYRRIDLAIDNGAKERLIAELHEGGMTSIASRQVVETNFRDGFKYIFADGSWLLIRPSGTEPVLRLYSEAGDPAVVEELLAAGRKIAGV